MMGADVSRKPVARLEPGDRVIFASRTGKPKTVRVVHTVDHTMRMPLGVVRVFYGRYGLKYVDAAGTHRVEIAEGDR